MAEQKAHSKLGASSMYRWKECPGSVALCELMPPQKSSEYAELGTKAHDLAEKRLRHGFYPPDADPEMIDYVDVYVDYVEGIWNKVRNHPNSRHLIEHRFDLSEVFPGLFGTCDDVVYAGESQTLYVTDLKYGEGIPVDVEGNLQLAYYGLGAALTIKMPIKTVVLAIAQPRYSAEDAIKIAEMEILDLLYFRSALIEAAKATEMVDAEIKTGDHCQFCIAKPKCPKLREEAELAFRADCQLANLGNLDQDTVGALMEKIDLIDTWVKGVRSFAYQEAQAGRLPTGWKLVPKRATRKWADLDKTQRTLGSRVNQNKLRDLMTEPELKSPAQVEKILGSAFKTMIEELVVAVSSGANLVPESDKRASIDKQSIADGLFTAQGD